MRYTVKKGDSLWKIAQAHGVSVSSIMRVNPQISDSNKIYVGMVLTIPTTSGESDKDHTALGEAFEKCLEDIKQLQSFKELLSLL